jgi:hypothetical protein
MRNSPQLYQHIIEYTYTLRLTIDQWKLKRTCLQLHDVSASKNSTTEDILKTHNYTHNCNLKQLTYWTLSQLTTFLRPYRYSNWQARPISIPS